MASSSILETGTLLHQSTTRADLSQALVSFQSKHYWGDIIVGWGILNLLKLYIVSGNSLFCSHKDFTSVHSNICVFGACCLLQLQAFWREQRCSFSSRIISTISWQNWGSQWRQCFQGKVILTTLLRSQNSMAGIVKVWDICYAVLGFPSTSKETEI